MTARRIGLDVGGSKVAGVALGPSGAIVDEVRMPTRTGNDGVVETILAAVDLLAPDGAASIGIGIPGLVDAGRVRHAVNLGVVDLELAAELASRTGAAVAVDNDVRAAALGEFAARGGRSLALLNIGTGVAAGLVLDGRLQRGASGAAGEIGHLVVDPAGPECPCGQRGCIEAFTGGGAIGRRWGSDAALPVREVFDAADAGDARARGIRDDAVRAIAAAVRVLALSVDVERIVFGGGVVDLGERLRPLVLRELRAEAAAAPFLATLALADRVVWGSEVAHAPARGAALLPEELALA
ncbi:ROK family protein [Microbacterium sp. gxy059]|uniref:ROK family protein n=1 Tax=Microbacterium sp. gxy059 TaxID=2957199 RepID=UPI003D985F5E